MNTRIAFTARLTAATISTVVLVTWGLPSAPAGAIEDRRPQTVSAILRDTAGVHSGEVFFTEEAGRVRVQVGATGLSPGWHGFHVHTKGDCTVNSGLASDPFGAAGGHLGTGAPLNQSHSNHDGDMPLLYANSDGVARATFSTDNFTFAQLMDADRSAVIVHAGPDNYAHIPADAARYRKAPFGPTDVGPDTATLATGDAGGRQSCGEVDVGPLPARSPFWTVASDGGVFSFSGARFHGSAAGIDLNQPMVGMASSPAGDGYWTVASDGGVFAFGGAKFAGSTGSIKLNRPMVGMAAPRAQATANLRDSAGNVVGSVQFTKEATTIRVDVSATGLSPGWHGFHVHAKGDCTVNSGLASDPFGAAGGHLGTGAPLNQSHSNHDGDMPLLYANSDGVARASFRTDNFTTDQLFDGDGSAVIVHAGPDNYAHIPTDAARYRKAPFGPDDVGPDTATLTTGDAGARQRCGVVQRIPGDGYWLAAKDGGVFAFGDAGFFGSTASINLNRPVTGMAATPSGLGYWLVADDGGVFAFGDARFLGSTTAVTLNAPIVGIAPTQTGDGYWLAAADGGVFAFGDAVFHGSTGDVKLDSPIVGIAATSSGAGYWMVEADNDWHPFGDASVSAVMVFKVDHPIRGIAAKSG